MTNSLKTLKRSEKDLDQINKKIELEKNRLALKKNWKRTQDAKLKRALGKMFLLSGVGRYINIRDLEFSEVIQIGAFLIISDLHSIKRSAVLGGLTSIFNQCEEKIYFKKQCEHLGADHFQGNKKLPYPFSLFLGVALKVKDFLSSENNYNKAHKIGDNIFTQHRQNKIAKYKQHLAQKNIKQRWNNEIGKKTRKVRPREKSCTTKI